MCIIVFENVLTKCRKTICNEEKILKRKLSKKNIEEQIARLFENLKIWTKSEGKMIIGQNVERAKCPIDKMSDEWNVDRTKCRLDKMLNEQTVELKKLNGQNVASSKCRKDKMLNR